jgi:hypothetical protein
LKGLLCEALTTTRFLDLLLRATLSLEGIVLLRWKWAA